MQADPEKAALRAATLARRRNLSREEITGASRSIVERFQSTSAFRNARSIAAYVAVNGEVDPALLLDQARLAGKTTYLPVLTEKGSLRFGPCGPHTRFTPNRYSIPEPMARPGELLGADQIDVIAVPVVVFDARGNRLGMGAGYYDRALAGTAANRPLRVGLAYEFQRAEALSPEPWDIPMDLIITERALYRTGSNGE